MSEIKIIKPTSAGEDATFFKCPFCNQEFDEGVPTKTQIQCPTCDQIFKVQSFGKGKKPE